MNTLAAHQSVLLKQAVDALAIKAGGLYVDATFGRGGHSRAILQQLDKNGQLIAIDRDPEAVAFGKEEFASDKRFEIIHDSFANLGKIMAARDKLGKVDGILLDLGVSSPQLDIAERGFSFLRDGPLDMRMNTSSGISAGQWIAETDEKDIAQVLWKYGEERFSRRIAKAIVSERASQAIETTHQLANIIEAAVPKKDKNKHPATRSFQAIRIEINNELDEIEQVLESSIEVLSAKGRLSVISFHSLEDRIVKRFIRDQTRGQKIPREIPITETQTGPLKGLSKGIKATEDEIRNNPRARSAVLRIAEKRAI